MSATAFDGLTLALAVATGSIALLLTRHLRAPGIVGLLAAGVAIGPDGLGWIHPDRLGDGLRTVVSLAVAVILFEGGLNLKIDQLRRRASVIRRLITWGSLVTAVGGTIAARVFMEWDWQTCILFGTLIIVTGPTVVTPLLRQIRVKRKLKIILEAEGILIDPIGAVIAVVCLDFIISSTVAPGEGHWLWMFWEFFLKLGIGLCMGLVAGLLVGWLLRHDEVIPDDMRNILTLSWILLVYELSNFLQHESGLMTVIIAGMVVGNLKTKRERELMDFNDQLTIMLIGLLFVLLSADVRLEDVKALGKPGLYVVLAVMFLIRPINVYLCTIGAGLNWKERLFMSWIAPRGIVAAAVASLFAFHLNENGVPGGEALRGLVFMVIAGTVVAQGFTAGPLASILGLRQKHDDGFVVIGASPLGQLLAHTLNEGGEPTTLVDRNHEDCQNAESDGLMVVYGNALEDRTMMRAAVETRRAVIALTPNEGVNLMALRKAEILDRGVTKYIALVEGSDLSSLQKADLDARILFGVEFDFDLWIHRLRHKQTEKQTWIYTTGTSRGLFDDSEDSVTDQTIQAMFLPLTIQRRKTIFPYYRSLSVQADDRLTILVDVTKQDSAKGWLEKAGFQRDS